MSQGLDPSGVPIVSTGRLRLRGWENADYDPYLDLVTDDEKMRYVGTGAISADLARRTFHEMREQWQDRGIGIFVIATREEGVPVGFSGLFESPLLDEPELCWSLFRGFEGAGYATEAAIAVRNWAFHERGFGPLMSLVHPDNLSSRAVAERTGAQIEGEATWLGSPRLVYRHILPAGSSSANRDNIALNSSTKNEAMDPDHRDTAE